MAGRACSNWRETGTKRRSVDALRQLTRVCCVPIHHRTPTAVSIASSASIYGHSVVHTAFPGTSRSPLSPLEHSGRQRADGDENRRKPWYSKLKLVVVRTKRGPTTTAAQRGTRLQPARFLTLLEGASGRPLQPPCTVAAVTLWPDLSKLNAACLCIWFIYTNPELLVVL